MPTAAPAHSPSWCTHVAINTDTHWRKRWTRHTERRTPSREPDTNEPCGSSDSGVNGGIALDGDGIDAASNADGNDENDASVSTCATTEMTLGL